MARGASSLAGPREQALGRALAVIAVLVTLTACGGSTSAPATQSPTKPASASVSAKPAGSASSSGAAKTLTPVVIGYPGVNMGDVQAWVATEGHIWEKHGLKVDLRRISSSAATMAALVSNQAQFIQVGGGDAVTAKAAGADVVVLAVPIPTYSYILETAPSIKTIADLKGTKLAVDSYGSPPEVALRVALRKYNLDPDKDVSIVPVGDVPTRTSALLSGAVQGTMLNPPYIFDVEAKGYHPLIDLAALKLPYANASPMALRSYMTAHKTVVQDYVDAFIEANNRVRHDKAFTLEVMRKNLGIKDEKQLEATYDYYTTKIFPAEPMPKAELFKDAIDQLAVKNPSIAGFDANTIIDTSFVQSAVDRGLVQN